ncbi:TIGR02186 family protein [Elioraea rosea]|uniref:TIGR02186 family protein n=1 Tax=Elioraea rosea TaxID=2492390 RepID=UPI001186941D|nr:TIGR02186 family protein [Elioraea rosea]
MRRAAIAALLVLTLLPWTRPATAQLLVAELSQREVAVTTGFSGAELLVFGTSAGEAAGPGGDVIVTLRGPNAPVVVRRKVRVAGIWLNGPSERFDAAPSFYAVASTRPVEAILPVEERRRLRIGLASLPLSPRGRIEDPTFRQALLELKQDQRLYEEDAEGVQIAADRLFHARLFLPPAVIPGLYRVEILLVRDGRVMAARDLPLTVVRAGTSAEIWHIAREEPLAYGVAAVFLAAFAGWLGSVLFRR